MQELKIGQGEYGQRLDKLLGKYLSQAPTGFLYKMLRKKNITLNDKKATGKEILKAGDSVKIYFSENTLEKFRTPEKKPVQKISGLPDFSKQILYEDEHILLANKPTGMLSQKASPEDVSFVELFHSYLIESGQMKAEDFRHFRPGVCNRLDRNTSGILVAGKTLIGLQILNQAFASRSIHKFYQCPVFGTVPEEIFIEGYLLKDERTNKAAILREPKEGSQPVKTRFRPLEAGRDATLLEVELITGRSHQIRAHLASISHPLFGDGKYGNRKKNELLRKKFGLKHQLLHAYKLEIPKLPGELSYLSGKTFLAPLPEQFQNIWKAYRR